MCIDKGGGSDLPDCAAPLEACAPADELGAGGVEQAIGEGEMGGDIAAVSAATRADAACLAVGVGLILQLLAALFCMCQYEVVGLVQHRASPPNRAAARLCGGCTFLLQ
jgi:hypothetical protein